jgi:hypothetical protein
MLASIVDFGLQQLLGSTGTRKHVQVTQEQKQTWSDRKKRGVQHANANYLEKRAKIAAERVFGVQFRKVRPDWLVNPDTGARLELDLLSQGDALVPPVAIEVNGLQHCKFVPHLHGTVEKYHAQQKRDLVKHVLCKRRGVILIDVPHHVRAAELEAFLTSEHQEKLREWQKNQSTQPK